jgi:hypothetical protein
MVLSFIVDVAGWGSLPPDMQSSGAVRQGNFAARPLLFHLFRAREARRIVRWIAARRFRDARNSSYSILLNKQVGSELGISEIMVKAHRGQVMRKTNPDSIADLANMTARLLTPSGKVRHVTERSISASLLSIVVVLNARVAVCFQ